VAAFVTFARFAEIVTSVDDFGRIVVTVNCALVAPAATVMLLGTAAMSGSVLDSVTVTPPAGATPLKVIVAVEEVPPRTLVGLRLIETSVGGGGVTVSAADRVTPPDVAEIVTVCADVTAFVGNENPTVVAPAGTVTLAGTAATAALLLDSATTAPPAGAAALSVTVPVDALPPVTLVGWRLSSVSDGAGVTVSWTDRVVPPPVEEIVTVVDVVTGLVATANVAVVLPAGTVTPPGTAATAVLALDSVTTAPLAGAAALRVTVPVDALPPLTLVGWRDSDANVTTGGGGGVTVSVAGRVSPPSVAVMVTVVDVVTALVVTGNVAVVLVEGMVTEAGTVAAAVLLLDSVTTAPPVALSATVPVDVPTPFTMIGVRVSDANVAAGGGGGGSAAVALQVIPPFVLFSTPASVPAYRTVGVTGSIARASTPATVARTALQLPPPSVLLTTPLDVLA